MKKQKPQDNTQGEPEEYKKKLEEYTNDLKRLQAEFENYKKRQEKENSHFVEYSVARVVSKLLVILDDFDSCLKSIKQNDEVTQGLLLLHKKLLKILQSEGLKEMAPEHTFDPYKHEVVLTIESDKVDGEIVEVIQKGYMLKDKVLRHAKVVLSKHRQGVKQNDNGKST